LHSVPPPSLFALFALEFCLLVTCLSALQPGDNAWRVFFQGRGKSLVLQQEGASFYQQP